MDRRLIQFGLFAIAIALLTIVPTALAHLVDPLPRWVVYADFVTDAFATFGVSIIGFGALRKSEFNDPHILVMLALAAGAVLIGILGEMFAAYKVDAAIALAVAAIVAAAWRNPIARVVAVGSGLLILAGEGGGMTATLLGAAGATGAAIAILVRVRSEAVRVSPTIVASA